MVSVSVLGTSYQNALKHAKTANEIGAKTIFGNDQAAVLGINMLRKREEIDYISAADIGELAFVAFIDYLNGKKQIEEVREEKLDIQLARERLKDAEFLEEDELRDHLKKK